jgi:hypothetical protein
MRSAVFLAAACASALLACTDDLASTSSTTQDISAKNRLATNRLATNRLATNRLATNRLATNRLAANRLAANMVTAHDLLSTVDGRTVYSYLVGCAVPSGTTIVADIPGAEDTTPDDPFTCIDGTCTFEGAVGVAPDWLTHRLSHAGEEWVSSCVFARCNAHDTSEAISLRGKSTALAVSDDEAALYTVEEGAFYGNLFTDDDEPIAWFSCEGEGQASGEFGGLVVRDCTEPMACKADHTCDPNPSCAGSDCEPLTCGDDGYCHDDSVAYDDNHGHWWGHWHHHHATGDGPVVTQCGFTWTGTCADFSPQYPSPYACRSFDAAGGYYGDCHDAAGQGHWQHLKQWDRVITTYVTP